MSCVYRVFVLIILMLLTACATCAILFPVYRAPKVTALDVTVKQTVFYWYSETSLVSSTSTQITRIYSHEYACDAQRQYFLAMAALAVAGAGIGGLACMFTACWINAGRRIALGVVALILTFFAFACCVVVVSISAYVFVNGLCKGSTLEMMSLKSGGYNLVEGFILMAVAAGGFLIMFVVEICGVCCSTCRGSDEDYDDISRDFSRYSSKSSRTRNDSYIRGASRNDSYIRGASRNDSYIRGASRNDSYISSASRNGSYRR
jgi:hypothetical protein